MSPFQKNLTVRYTLFCLFLIAFYWAGIVGLGRGQIIHSTFTVQWPWAADRETITISRWWDLIQAFVYGPIFAKIYLIHKSEETRAIQEDGWFERFGLMIIYFVGFGGGTMTVLMFALLYAVGEIKILNINTLVQYTAMFGWIPAFGIMLQKSSEQYVHVLFMSLVAGTLVGLFFGIIPSIVCAITILLSVGSIAFCTHLLKIGLKALLFPKPPAAQT